MRRQEVWNRRSPWQKRAMYALGIDHYLGIVSLLFVVNVHPLGGLAWGVFCIVGGIVHESRRR